MKNKVIITEMIDDEGLKLLKNNLNVDVCTNISREDLLNKISEYDAIIVRSNTKVDEKLLEKGKNLKIIGRAGNGIDNIDVSAATKRGIIVANTPQSNTMSACELTIGLLLSQSRNIPQANNDTKKGNWGRNSFKGVELYGKTLGIIGLGKIGSLVATRMAAFGMNIIAYDPYITNERFERFKAKRKDTLRELIKESDFITIHTPKTKETIGMIGEEEIKYMKYGVRIVNAARGGIINEKALLKGIKEGKIASAALDVHEVEPCFNSDLFNLENVIVTPHIGAGTIEAQENVGKTIAAQVINALKGEIVTNAVNLPTIHRDELKVIKPYIDLMEKLGKIYYQINNDPIEFVDIEYFGDIASQDIQMITIAFIKGLLEPVVKENVNYINAIMCAKNRGIVINERKIKDSYKNYVDSISIKIKSENNTFNMLGSLSAKKEGKLVEIQGYEVDVNPSEYMLFIQNLDVPGVIGDIGMVLGKNKINVATMQVGRNIKGEKALMILNIDENVSKEAVKEISQVKNVLWAKGIRV
ncbi:phosphoglycerate dehydrogenase [Tepidibacter formicigenes]|uniref:D-3-phosphoglycerate dehydrogenase n=1 Tax=Tepidibacter formicigenes DSM 15518 TaxID=1123349 RepID=A0A1M6RY14_9FIRM|nr:phosphoglycerate dehydrogenase [Tepidibacter formicigenes]SHK37207.1 D-3-phosphoglycerate dehydrogenase [Tepidibacter formicigenes DSM 15518]